MGVIDEENKKWDERAKCTRYEGYYFYPRSEVIEEKNLVKLSFSERRNLYTSPGLYLTVYETEDNIDFQCAMDNSRTPTHKEVDAKPPSYGDGILLESTPTTY